MNKRFGSSTLCLFLIFSLCGCSLAVPDAGAEGGGDRMIGAFITKDYLDLFDMDSWLNDNAARLVDGRELQVSYDSRYAGRLYAEIDKSKGDDPIDWEISFGDVEGLNMFTPLWTTEDGETYWGSVCAEGICDPDIQLYESEDSEEHSISGTVYILAGRMDKNSAYYANPVYQTADGDIYVTQGHGFSTSGESSEGEQFSTSLSGETTVTGNGQAKTEKSSVTVRYAVMYRPAGITFCQMDREHQIVRQDNYEPGEVPEELTAEEDTEYILVETEKEGLAGQNVTVREVYGYSPDEEVYLETFYARDDGIVGRRETRVFWDR